MPLSGLIGLSLLGAGAVATFLVGTLRRFLLPWCPSCGGRGALGTVVDVASCDVCLGSGLLRVPDTAPADWFSAS